MGAAVGGVVGLGGAVGDAVDAGVAAGGATGVVAGYSVQEASSSAAMAANAVRIVKRDTLDIIELPFADC